MSNTSVKVAFAFIVILAYPAASLARHAVTTAMNSAPIKTMDSSSHGKCVLDSSATIAAPNRAAYSVCWAPEDITDGPGV
jgi:hypothetical protein